MVEVIAASRELQRVAEELTKACVVGGNLHAVFDHVIEQPLPACLTEILERPEARRAA